MSAWRGGSGIFYGGYCCVSGMQGVMTDRRRYPRYTIFSPIAYRSEDNRLAESSIAINVSNVGALISAYRPAVRSSILIIKFIFRSEEFRIRSRVIHSSPEPYDIGHKVGVEFLEMPYSFIKKMGEEVDTIKLFRDQYSKDNGVELPLEDAAIKWYRSSGEWAKI